MNKYEPPLPYKSTSELDDSFIIDNMFSGKTVVITGSSSGIGADAAAEFAKEKACLVLHGRNQASLEGVKKECISVGSPEVLYVLGDITDEDVQQNLLQTALDKFKKIDVLVNNAGTVLDTSVENFDIKTFDSVFDVNFRSAVRAVTPGSTDDFSNLLKLQKHNKACTFTSIHKDRVPNVRVPLMRYGTTRETSQAILFLASDKASYTTGNIFMVDGGMSLSTIDIEPGPVVLKNMNQITDCEF
uniref:Uncharacterized protein n=1 Tax=Romanomermis culicivorax TaxID=13658 RepID=A0A915IN33_ROMCU